MKNFKEKTDDSVSAHQKELKISSYRSIEII